MLKRVMAKKILEGLMVFFMVVGLGLFIVGCGDETGTSSSSSSSGGSCPPGSCYVKGAGVCCPNDHPWTNGVHCYPTADDCHRDGAITCYGC